MSSNNWQGCKYHVLSTATHAQMCHPTGYSTCTFQADEKKHLPKCFGAGGSPIDIGQLAASRFNSDGQAPKIHCDGDKATRPLLCVFKMTARGNKIEFTGQRGTIQVKGSNRKTTLRQEGRLFMLDLLCQVPINIAELSPFTRQVAKA